MKATDYYLNLNYVCNERCVFCAADVHTRDRNPRVKREVTLDEVRHWIAGQGPGRHDRVSLAGGEPTLHSDLIRIVQLLAKRRPEIILFTNGLRLADDPEFARATVAAGVSNYQIAFFGASASVHDSVTGVPGSFEKTISAIQTLVLLRRKKRIRIVIRLLVSRQSLAENPNLVSVIARRTPEIDEISLNRMIFSRSAEESDAAISWDHARTSINLAARRVLQHGYRLEFMQIPFCVFDSDLARYIESELHSRQQRIAQGKEPSSWSLRYLDPQQDGTKEESCMTRRGLPDVCFHCFYVNSCQRVEPWYVRRFGTHGLVPVGSKRPDSRNLQPS